MLVVLLLAGAGWLLADARHARSELTLAAGLVTVLQDQVLAGDRSAAQLTLVGLQDHAASALGATQGPHWWVAGLLPWAGPNVRAVQGVAEVVDGLADRALPGLLEATALVDADSLAPVGGRVDLEPLLAAAPVVVAANREVQAAAARVAEIDSAALWPSVAAPLADLGAQVRHLATTTATAEMAATLLPAMLGAEGARDYLLLVQNNAELRATGGIAGSVVLLRADDGRVEVIEQRSGGPLIDLPAPVVPLTAAELALFGDDLAADMRDVTFTPDFPRTAAIARALWAQQVGGQVDGVLSVDPVALALLLAATGPVALDAGPVADAAGGALTSDNAVEVLLSTVYRVLADPADQDAFFAATAADVFAAVIGGQGGSAGSVGALAEAARQGRLMVWSADPDEAALLAKTVLGGHLRGAIGDTPVVGVFMNDGTRAKMGYYLRTEVSVVQVACEVTGSRLVTVSVTLTNTATADVAGLPSYVTGGGAVVPVGVVRTNLLLYAPEGGRVETVRTSRGEPAFTSQVQDGLSVVGQTTELEPGGSLTVDYDVLIDAAHTGAVVVRTTPQAFSQVIEVRPALPCP